MVTFFWPKVAKKCQKSQNLRFLISTVWKLLSEVEPYRTINNEVDVAKKCYQVWQKVAKVAKKCYQMWQKVAKGVLRGLKVSRGSAMPGDLRAGTLRVRGARLPALAGRLVFFIY